MKEKKERVDPPLQQTEESEAPDRVGASSARLDGIRGA